jgi:hypothetical protein
MRLFRPSTILFIVALAVASCQCVLTCAESASPASHPSQETSSVPPCHQQSSPKHEDAPQACAHPRVVAEERVPSASTQPLVVFQDALAVAQSDLLLPPPSVHRVVGRAPSPPLSPELARSTVLRV